MATTACSGVLGKQMADPGQDAKVQQQPRVLPWATPGQPRSCQVPLIVLGAQQGEQFAAVTSAGSSPPEASTWGARSAASINDVDTDQHRQTLTSEEGHTCTQPRGQHDRPRRAHVHNAER